MRYATGDRIEIRDAHGVWHPSVAQSDIFLNSDYVPRGVQPWRVVRVLLRDGDVVNWPEADVRRAVPSPRGGTRGPHAMKIMAFLAVAFLLAAPTSAGATQDLHEGGGGRAPLLVPNTQQVTDTLRALDRLARYGYSVGSPARAERAIKAWQRSNGLVTDGIVGVQTLASLGLAASASVPAVRVDPPVAAPPPPVGDVEQIIRDVWPDELEDRAVAIATRESRLQPAVINRNGNATGLFQIMWTVHRGWLCPQLGVCAQSDLQDARTNATAAYALYQRDGGFGPWRL